MTLKSLLSHFDLSSLIVIILTLVLFVAAVFVKGFTHDLLLEAGVFLVSVKLILMGHKNSLSAKSIEERLKDIQSSLPSSMAQK
jgi:hypothetical protein